jgi:hypothetical protein
VRDDQVTRRQGTAGSTRLARSLSCFGVVVDRGVSHSGRDPRHAPNDRCCAPGSAAAGGDVGIDERADSEEERCDGHAPRGHAPSSRPERGKQGDEHRVGSRTLLTGLLTCTACGELLVAPPRSAGRGAAHTRRGRPPTAVPTSMPTRTRRSVVEGIVYSLDTPALADAASGTTGRATPTRQA